MPIQLFYRTPDMPKGANLSAGVGFSDRREVEDFLQDISHEMPDNTLFYYREGPVGMAGRVWIAREGRLLQIWSSRIYRRDGITMAQAMAAAPKLSTLELRELFN